MTGKPRTLIGGAARKTPARRPRSRAAAAHDTVAAALAAFAHEVRTPLTGILAVSDLLATSNLNERERRWAEMIKASAEHLSSLTTLFVDAARGSRGVLLPRQDAFDLRRFTATLAQSLDARAQARGLGASIRIPKSLPQYAVGDAVRLRAALENLIDNAVKFTERGDIALAVRASKAGAGAIVVSFEIADRGIGLSVADLRKLFKPFSQASLAIAQRFGGAGLGLSSARRFAQAMGGDIKAASRKGGGAAFTLTARLARADKPSTPRRSRAARAIDAQPLRVLAVEDNPYGRVVLNAILTELGHRTEFAGSGEEALDRLTLSAFDAVLMDMVLPGVGGLAAIERIRARKASKSLAIVGISGRDADAQAARDAGADAFLVKPVAPRLLAQTMADAVAARKATTRKRK